MAMHFIYDGTDMGVNVVRLGTVPGFITEAALGAVGMCGIAFDDPASGLTVTGWKSFVVNEDQSPFGQRRLFTGYIADRKYLRGQNDSLILGADRIIDTTLVELNTLLSFRLFPQSDSTANRPSETDVARINWLLGTSYISSVFDNGLINSSGPITLDAADYRGQSASSLLTDCANASGKNYFLYWDETRGQNSLFYDFDYGTAYTCTLSLSNVLSDINDTTCFGYAPDAVLDRDPSRVYSGVQVPFSGTGSPVYRTRAATVTKFGVSRDTTAPNVNIKTAAAANAIGDRYLASIDTEDDKVTCSVQLPAAKVGLIRAGMRILFRSSFMPDLDAFTYLRILRVEIKQDQPTQELYTVALELAPPAPSVSLTCSYVPATISTPSSTDILGGHMGSSGLYTPAASLYPTSAVIEIGASTAGTQPLILYGTTNNGSNWGIYSGVNGAGPSNRVRWKWDLNAAGSPAICTVQVAEYVNHSPYITIEASPDGTTWTQILDNAALTAAGGAAIAITPFQTYRYWSLLYNGPVAVGYYPGFDMSAVLLWSAS